MRRGKLERATGMAFEREQVGDGVTLFRGDCLDVMATLGEGSVDAIVTDPPYHLTQVSRGGSPRGPGSGPFGRHTLGQKGFMGKTWDGGDVAFRVETWGEAFRVLKPGGHLLAFGGTRTFHRLVCAIEDAGFEIRDQLAWVYGQGFPKSLDVSKAIDKAAGAKREVVGVSSVTGARKSHTMDDGCRGAKRTYQNETPVVNHVTAPATVAARQWDGWGTALKPAMEPICLARKPLSGTVAANVLEHGTGALNVDGCRVGSEDGYTNNAVTQGINTARTSYAPARGRRTFEPSASGRWPANFVHDGSEQAVGLFPVSSSVGHSPASRGCGGVSCDGHVGQDDLAESRFDVGSAARFFYCAKASKEDRGEGNRHPTVKPVDLMAWLVRLVTPPGGVVLDPFAGSGSTGKACALEGMRFVGIEREADSFATMRRRLAATVEGDLLASGFALLRRDESGVASLRRDESGVASLRRDESGLSALPGHVAGVAGQGAA